MVWLALTIWFGGGIALGVGWIVYQEIQLRRYRRRRGGLIRLDFVGKRRLP
jgi:hypothetical protein